MSDLTRSLKALFDVIEELERQDKKWGEQNHPNGTGPDVYPFDGIDDVEQMEPCDIDATTLMVRAKGSTDFRARINSVTWRDILLEEVFEALAEDVPWKLREELIQVAAVATQWVEAIDRKIESAT